MKILRWLYESFACCFALITWVIVCIIALFLGCHEENED